jgi:ABC-type Fe3+/spermidine/putrescine transport system ATPase subunit
VADRIGVMMDGRLQQVGSPRDFYQKPASAEIARFFGASNFLPGIKRGQIVQTGIGEVEIAPSALDDGPVMLTLPPEAIEVGANGHNNFPARVRLSSDRLPAPHYQVDISGIQLHLALPPYSSLNGNEDIMLHLPKERISVLPPEEEPSR